MSSDLSQLEIECRRATEEFLALDWGHLKTRVRAAVEEMRSTPNLNATSLAFLLKQSAKLPVQSEPSRRLNDLVAAISTLRLRKKQVVVSFADDARTRGGMVA